MFLRESVRRCERCEEITPHVRRLLAWPGLAAWSGVGAIGLALFATDRWPLGAGLVLLALFRILRGREHCLWIECQRCQSRAVRAQSRTRPTLDGKTVY